MNARLICASLILLYSPHLEGTFADARKSVLHPETLFTPLSLLLVLTIHQMKVIPTTMP